MIFVDRRSIKKKQNKPVVFHRVDSAQNNEGMRELNKWNPFGETQSPKKTQNILVDLTFCISIEISINITIDLCCIPFFY